MNCAQQWLTLRQIVDGTGLPEGTVYRLAHQHGWRRRDRFNPKRYLASDVQATLAERDALADGKLARRP